MDPESRKRKPDGFVDDSHDSYSEKATEGSRKSIGRGATEPRGIQSERRAGIDGHKIIVGVDYGTTFTGVSYVATDKSDINDIAVITTWPGPTRDMEVVSKVPSRIAYPFDNPYMQTIKCGFQVESRMKSYSWTKLLLDGGTQVTNFDDADLKATENIGILRLPKDKDATSVTADFLESIYKHTMSVLAKQISQEALDTTPIEFWFTMPAIWSDKAQDATRAAAQQAGFTSRLDDQMFMITEPEAAAIATLKKSTTDTLSAPIKLGDSILICDCGGGTVDITTYSIAETYPILQFEELCTGIGGKCGSSSIDRNLYRLMLDRFGKEFHDLQPQKKGPGSEFMKAFELVKHDFGHSDENRIYELPLNMTAPHADSEHFDEDERLVKLTRDDVQLLFDPVVEKIISLLKEQLTAANKEAGGPGIQHIILVGGFGDSEYLHKALVKEFASSLMKITVPEKPQAAIVRGAALRGLEGTHPTTRRCRCYYGFTASMPFREGIDVEAHSFIDIWGGRKMVRGTMKWMVAKGMKVFPNTIARFTIAETFYEGNAGVSIVVPLYSCGLDDPPGRLEHPRVLCVGTIIFNLSDIDPKMVQRKTNHEGRRVCLLNTEIRVIFGAKEGVLTVQTAVGNKVVGNTNINYGKD